MSTAISKRPLGTRWCQTGIILAIVAMILTVAGLAGGRTGALPGIAAFSAFGIGSLLFMLSVATGLVGLVLSRGTAGDASTGQTVAALVAGVIVIAGGLSQRPDASGAPPIHDLTTDTVNPPEFVAIVPLRADAPNPPEYLNDGSAEQQHQAYPSLATLELEMPAAQVFAVAEGLVAELGWELVDASLADGRIEATDTTYWFGFKDDVVLRIAAAGPVTRVDVRSKSRVGRGDMGTNARRIRSFIDALTDKTGT